MQLRPLNGRARLGRPLADGAVALVVLAAFWAPPLIREGIAPVLLPGVALAVLTAAAVVFRRRSPGVATATAAAATVAGGVLGVCRDPMLAAAWCLYALAVARAARTRGPAILVACGFALLLAVTGVDGDGSGLPGGRVVFAAVALTSAWLLGTAVGRQLESAREAERARVQLNVAREVHDVVGHALGVIAAQAGVTRGLPDAGDDELRGTLAEIETRARDALRETQSLVRDLRDPGPVPAAGPAETALASLIDGARAAGLTVDAHLDAGPAAGGGTRMVVFRIVQEALHNVVRHAPGARCSVRVGHDEEEIQVWIRDHGSTRPGAGAGSGVGLRGMRERAALAGGTVSWRRPAGGGFEITARLPVGRR
ncbi:sensor histidine kinase [Actinoplanes couchii]|uniref:sensor histidine kinase n=1 Tax=Actinoplanes couchii TaxID=403638 RepID=UPI00194267C4|nr:histidine kinase [Actinoplanes couchii]MDR6321272.1 signal transduction histidine kinase [Actinoplanes couchii]